MSRLVRVSNRFSGVAVADPMLQSRLAVVCMSLLLVACQGIRADYFPIGAETLTGLSAEAGQAVYIGLSDLVTPEDAPVTLIALSVPGLPPDIDANAFVLERGESDGGGIGAVRDGDWGPINPDLLQPLRGYMLQPGRQPVQLVVRLAAPSTAAVVEFGGFALTFAPEGGSQQTEDFPNGGRVWYCVRGADCADPSIQPAPFIPTESHGTSGARS
jgi:hypothetical protein